MNADQVQKRVDEWLDSLKILKSENYVRKLVAFGIVCSHLKNGEPMPIEIAIEVLPLLGTGLGLEAPDQAKLDMLAAGATDEQIQEKIHLVFGLSQQLESELEAGLEAGLEIIRSPHSTDEEKLAATKKLSELAARVEKLTGRPISH